MLIPPFKFSWINADICRSCTPHEHNILFLSTLGLKSILSIDSNPLDLTVDIPTFHSQFSISKMDALLNLIAKLEKPLLITCKDGRDVSLVQMVLRKLDNWALDCIFAESNRFVTEWEPESIDYIKSFKLVKSLPVQPEKITQISRTLDALDLHL